jgi:hypothetical protein
LEVLSISETTQNGVEVRFLFVVSWWVAWTHPSRSVLQVRTSCSTTSRPLPFSFLPLRQLNTSEIVDPRMYLVAFLVSLIIYGVIL